jgi:hypothetical protein
MRRHLIGKRSKIQKITGGNVMGRFDRLINAGALGGALLFSGAAFAQSNYPYFYPVEKMKGVYYTAGTPVLQAVGPIAPAGPTSFTMAGPPLAAFSASPPAQPLMTGRSVAVGAVGNHCQTQVTTCLLDRSSVQGKGCGCEVGGRWRRGVVTP